MYFAIVMRVGCVLRPKNAKEMGAQWTLKVALCRMASFGLGSMRTTILSLKYRFPSDQRSQRISGQLSSRLGDERRKIGVVRLTFCSWPSFCLFCVFIHIFAFYIVFCTFLCVFELLATLRSNFSLHFCFRLFCPCHHCFPTFEP